MPDFAATLTQPASMMSWQPSATKNRLHPPHSTFDPHKPNKNSKGECHCMPYDLTTFLTRACFGNHLSER